MKRIHSIISAFAMCSLFVAIAGCNPAPLTEADVFTPSDAVAAMLQPGDSIYHLNDFVATFMTEQGNFLSDSTPYRTRATNGDGIYLFSLDTIPTDTIGIYIRGRVSTDDYGGNFYKSIVIQEIVDGEQQNLRLSVDIGSANGLYQMGQELLIRCNGFSIGRYGDQPQLCVPSYNNNTYASSANQKIGWMPGRIPNGMFRNATTLIGTPAPEKLQYDTITIADYINVTNETEMRKMDGRLVVLKNVYFTGQYEYNGLNPCNTNSPEIDKYANVFAPTTRNVGHPQSRVISDGKNTTLVSNSEYSKFAYFYLPGADSTGIANCANYVGTVTGVLGQFRDNAKYAHDQYDWSITPRNIQLTSVCDINDIVMFHKETGEPWVPQEYKK